MAPCCNSKENRRRESSVLNISRIGKIVLVVILVGTLGLRLLHLANHLQSPLAHPEDVMPSTDIAAFATWAKKIVAGDVLCRDTYHPYMDWMGPIAPLQTFERWWGGKEIYHQAPLYPYLLAASYWWCGSSLLLLLTQVLLSTLSVYLVFRIASVLVDERAGLFAAGFAALFAPSIVLDSLLLRASLNSSFTVISVWLLLRLRDRIAWGLALGTGAMLAAGLLLRETALLLMVLGPAVLLLSEGHRRKWLRWVPALVAGIVVCMAPFVVRNIVVGAPALAFSTRGPETVLHGNHREADPGFMTTPSRPEDYGPLMEKGHESTLAALSAAVGTWPERGRLGWWLWHELRKLQATLRDFEYSNNINFYYYRRATPVLEYLPTFGWFVGIALVGLVLLEFRGRDGLGTLILLAALAAFLAGLLLTFASGRYRMPLAMLLTVPAGVMLSSLFGLAGERRFGPLGTSVAAAVALSALSFLWAATLVTFQPGGPQFISGRDARILEANTALRPQEFVTAAKVLHERGQTDTAQELLGAYLAEVSEAVRGWLRGASGPGQRLLLGTMYGRLAGFAGYLEQQGLDTSAARFRERAERYRKMSEGR